MTARGKPVSALWRQTAISAAIACVFAAGQAQANGTDPTVVEGQASFTTLGSSLSITNSPGAIINWQGFSIGASETTSFIQQSAASSVLNRVIGPDPSVILGTLTSNGRVFLINPSGILVGQGARIDVAGLVASTLNLSNQDFLAGRLNFASNPLAGNVENQGSITTPSGGSVYLVGANVSNSGIINSPQGDVILAAGQSVNILDSSTPGVRVEITASDNVAVNLGEILAQSGQVGIYGAALRNAGIINADQVGRDASGKIVLRAKQDLTLEAGSRLSANGEQGGDITVQSETGTTLVSGTIEAKGTGAAAGKGGTVQLLGNHVGLITASVNVSGTIGGGTALIGGDYQGMNPSVQNASATYVSQDSTINADAINSGNGGKVILWADSINRYYGNISARGGVHGGDGGFAEVSGKNNLMFGGYVDLRAPSGSTGTLLLDPLNITIQDAAPNVNGDATVGDDLNAAINTPNILFADYAGNSSVITTSQVVTQLATANVTLQATNDITVAAAIDASGNAAGKALTLQAGHDVIVNAAIAASSAGGGSLILSAGNNVTAGAALTANGGSVSLLADNDGTGPGVAGGTVTFGAVTASNLTIRFNPANYTTTSAEIAAYAPKATLSGTAIFDARAWTFVNNASATAQNKTYNGTTAAILNIPFALKSAPDGVTAGQRISLTAGGANFDSKNVSATSVNFTGYGLASTLGSTDVNLYALFSQPASQTALISAKAITATSILGVNKFYNATLVAGLNTAGGVVTGGAAADGDNKFYTADAITLNAAGATGAFATKDVGTNKAVTVSDLLLGNNTAGNYTVTDASAATANISAKAITATGILGVDKTYNTTLVAGLNTTGGVVTGGAAADGDNKFYTADAITLNVGGATGAFADKNVGTGKAVTVSGLALGNNALGNYTVTDASVASANITTKALTASGLTGINKVYNTTLVDTLSGTAVVANGALTDGDGKYYTADTVNVTGTPAGAFADKNVGTAKSVAITGLGVDNTNYTVSHANTSADITTKALTASGLTGINKVYNTTLVDTLSGTAVVANGALTDGDGKYYTADTVNVTGTPAGAFADKNVGTAKSVAITGLGVDNTNYTVSHANTSADITTKALIITGFATDNKVYDGLITAVISAAGTLSGVELGDSVGFSNSGATFDTKNIGVGKTVTLNGVTLTGTGDQTNYSYTAPTTDLSDITSATLIVLADALGKVYGVADPTLTYTASGFQLSDTAGSVLSGVLARAAGENVGSYAIGQNTLASNANYTITYTGNNFGITPAPLNVAANPQSKLFSTSDPVLTFNVAGLVNNPALGIADTAATVLSGVLTRIPGETASGGPYAINQGSLVANSNYTLGFTPNNLIITGAAVAPILDFNPGQIIFTGIINNDSYYRPGNFWHISLNYNNADPGFDVMRGTSDLNSRLSDRLNSCDSVSGGGFCETWSFPQQRDKANEK